jgi:solute:Na+ symporter, SSS family
MKDKDFYLAGRDISAAKLTFSLLATIIGASSSIGLMGFALSIGIPATLWLVFGSLGLFFLGLIYSKFLLQEQSYTIAEFLGKIYGPRVKKITSWVIFLSWVGIIAAQLIALKKLIDIFTPQAYSIAVLFFITVLLGLYTIIGGQKAVVITDRVQLLVFLSGFLVLNALLIKEFGFNALFGTHEYLKFPINNNFSTKDFFYLALLLVPVYIIGPDIHSRIFCARNIETVKRALNISALALVPISLLIVAPAIMVYNIYGASDSANILSLLFNSLLNYSYFGYMFLIAIICALLSSADSCLMTSAAIFTRDILNITKDKSVYIARIIIGSLITATFILSLYFQDIIQVLKSSYSIYTTSIFIPFIFIPFKERLNLRNSTIFISMIISGSLGGLFTLLGLESGVLYAYLISGSVIYILSWLRR